MNEHTKYTSRKVSSGGSTWRLLLRYGLAAGVGLGLLIAAHVLWKKHEHFVSNILIFMVIIAVLNWLGPTIRDVFRRR